MNIQYTLEEKDYLTYQLYTASKSERIIKKRWRNKVMIPIIYAMIGLVFLLDSKPIVCISFVAIAAIWYFFFPIWEKSYYMKHYSMYIREHYPERIGRIISMQFDHEYIRLKDEGSEISIMTNQVIELIELPSIIFIKLETGESVILPKDRIPSIEMLISTLKEFAVYLNVKYTIDEECEWLH